MLDFLRQLFLDITLHSAQEERSQDRLQLLDDADVERLVLVNTLAERVREPLFKVLLVAEDLRHQEVHERPELHHIILQGCASQQKSTLGVEAKECLPALRLEILDVLGLVEDHVVPLLAAEGEVILNDELI